MNLITSMLDYKERTKKDGLHAVLATYRAFQNHLSYDFFRAQMTKAGVKVPNDIKTLEMACKPKTETVTIADLVAGYISKRAGFERCDLKEYLITKRDYVDDGHLTKTIKIFTNSGAIERIGKGVYLSNVAA